MEPLMEIQHGTKTIIQSDGMRNHVLQDVSFRLYPNEIVGIAGRSGAGKSTLARSMIRLTDMTAGTLWFQGQNITKLQGKALRPFYKHVQMVFQSPQESFDPHHTLAYSIAEQLRNQGIQEDERRRRVQQIMEQCGLDGKTAACYPHEVSGGQCQRAAIARALIGSPDVLICDEITSALDTITQQQIITLLRQCNAQRGMACVFICHNLALAQQFCDCLFIMHEGWIVENGKTADVLRHPKSDYTKELIEAVL